MDAEQYTREIEDLFCEWENRCRACKLRPGFVRDAVLYPDFYFTNEPRIAFVLKDTNDLREPDFCKVLRDKPWVRLQRWSAIVLGLGDSPDDLNKAWQHVAILNLKKLDGISTAPASVIDRHVECDRELILKEFELLDPCYVLMGGVASPKVLSIFGLDGWSLDEKGHGIVQKDGRKFISFYHPSVRGKGMSNAELEAKLRKLLDENTNRTVT